MRIGDLQDSLCLTAVSLPPGIRMADAAAEMVRCRQSAILVTDAGRLHGILTRDDLVAWLAQGRSDGHNGIEAAVSSNPPVVSTERRLEQVIAEMTTNAWEHMVLMDGGRIVGLLRLNDLLLCQAHLLRREIEHLHDYIDTMREASED